MQFLTAQRMTFKIVSLSAVETSLNYRRRCDRSYPSSSSSGTADSDNALQPFSARLVSFGSAKSLADAVRELARCQT